MRVTVVRQADDLHRETWEFALYAGYSDTVSLSLSRHSSEIKPTSRHRKWQETSVWSRFVGRNAYAHPIPADVVQEAKDSFEAAIQAAKVDVGGGKPCEQ